MEDRGSDVKMKKEIRFNFIYNLKKMCSSRELDWLSVCSPERRGWRCLGVRSAEVYRAVLRISPGNEREELQNS